MTTLTSKYGNVDQKGTVLGIFRSLGALARAVGPIIASIGKTNIILIKIYVSTFFSHLAFWSIGSTLTYIIGGFSLIIPTLMLQYSKLS